MGVDDLLLPIAAASADTFAGRWSWLLPCGFRPFALALFGDLFVEDAQGTVHLLDAMEGVLRPIAASREAFAAEVSRGSEAAREWLLADSVELLRERGVVPGPGQCYGWKVPPLLGAPLTTDNVEVFEIDRYQVIVSAILEPLKGRPSV